MAQTAVWTGSARGADNGHLSPNYYHSLSTFSSLVLRGIGAVQDERNQLKLRGLDYGTGNSFPLAPVGEEGSQGRT